MGSLQERITSTREGSITSIQAVYVLADDLTNPAPAMTFAHLDATIVLSRVLAAKGIYPTIDPLHSTSTMLQPQIVAYSPATITGYLFIESLSGTNFRKWKKQISIILGVMDLDYALRVDAPAALTAESSTEQKAAYEKWERSNRISLMIMKGSITTTIQGAIPDSDNAKLYLAHIEEQFQGSSKAHATTLITKMVTLKYSGSNGVREHILRMNDMASQLKGLDMEISEGFLVHFIMTSLPAQFGPFKINYNTQKEKWKMSELISMCVQEEERLKSEQPDSPHVAITGPSKGKGKGKKFGKGNVQGNKSASVTKTDKASSSGTKGSSGPRTIHLHVSQLVAFVAKCIKQATERKKYDSVFATYDLEK
ncbi:hypothetical protein RJ639_007519 [Escallonia herrerae]|uniref:H(+)-transporting two-sector ATPase n=1 Tax=Escallonia herrerae TaxID=1293975 RepID=A0AA89AWT4_9ASTE|nr:hypothetical protein RJ639_007519 [Escallonia herrerae]